VAVDVPDAAVGGTDHTLDVIDATAAGGGVAPDGGRPRRRWFVAGWAGGAVGLLVQAWMLTAGTFRLFAWQRVSDFYDAQAHAWLDGTWAIEPKLLGIEAFYVGDEAYMYQPPVPALLRVPVAAFTDRLDGRLTALSMLLAAVVATVFVIRLSWRVRTLVRADAPVGRLDQVVAAVLVAVVVGGSSLVFAASRPWVYHEAIAWGVALSLASYDHVIAYVHRPSARSLLWAGIFATLAFLTRASVGFGPVAALALLAGAALVGAVRASLRRRDVAAGERLLRWTSWFGGQDDTRWRTVGFLAGAAALPVVIYATVNAVKFGTPFSIPFDQQGFTRVDAGRREMLALNGGSYFRWQFVPTNLFQYARPDMLGFTGRFPFVTFPTKPVHVFGQLRYDLIDATASLPATFPVLMLPGLAGLAAIVRPWRRLGDVEVRPLRIPVLAAIVGTVSVLNIGYIAHRYLADFLPLVLLCSLVAVHLLVAAAARGERRGTGARWVLGGLAVLAVFSVWTNLSLAWTFQRAYGPTTLPGRIRTYVEAQLRTQDPRGQVQAAVATPQAPAYDRLPAGGRFDDVILLPGCAAVYWSDGMRTNAVKVSSWNAAERSADGGAFDLTVDVPRLAAGERVPLFTSGRGDTAGIVWIEGRGGSDVVVGYDGPGQPWEGRQYRLEPGRHHVWGWADPNVANLAVYIGDQLYLETYYDGDPRLRFARNDVDATGVAATFPGTIEVHPIDTPLCRRLQASLDAAG
jgi:hypothetical protein